MPRSLRETLPFLFGQVILIIAILLDQGGFKPANSDVFSVAT